MYLKQKSDPTKNYWYCSLQKDFQFIGLNLTDEEIKVVPRFQYKKMVRTWVQKAAFAYFMEEKLHHSKLNDLTHSELKLQPNLQI